MLGKLQDRIIKKMAGVIVWTNAITDACKGIVAVLTLAILLQEAFNKLFLIKSPSKIV